MKHIKQLDGLRGVAMMFVLVEHFGSAIGRHISAGYYGVDLFFVLSGFLITGILLNQEGPVFESYKNFIGRRTLRIFPIYYLALLALYLMGNKEVHQYTAYYATYTYNYAWAHYKIPLNETTHFWSLCVEEQFYIFWPFLILGLRKHCVLLGCIISIIVVACALQLCFNIVPLTMLHNKGGLLPQGGQLATGAFGALLLKEGKMPHGLLKNKWAEWFFLALLAALLLSKNPVKFAICPFISLFFILKATEGKVLIKPINRFLQHKTVVYIGVFSYGIYLYHILLHYYVFDDAFNWVWSKINFEQLGALKKLRWNAWIFKLPLFSIAAIGFASLSYRFIEKPILSLKDKWFPYK